MTDKKMNKSAIQRRLIPSYIFLIIVCFISVFPIYWMVTAATNTSYDVSQGKIWFGTYAAENYKVLLERADATLNMTGGKGLWKIMANSFIYAGVQTVLCIFICSLAGFGFELYHDRKKDALFGILLLAMMIPGVATLIPLFRMVSGMKLLNTVFAFIIPGIATPFMIMMFRQNSRNFPIDIMEAARLDGLSEIEIFFRMYMPVMKSTCAAAAVITIMNAWNAYMWPRAVMADNRAATMQMMIANLAGGYTVDYGVLMMGVLFCSIPTMAIFFILQKQFAEGITGSVK